MQLIPLELVKSNLDSVRKAREACLIKPLSWKKATGPGSSRNLLNSTKNMKCMEGSKEN